VAWKPTRNSPSKRLAVVEAVSASLFSTKQCNTDSLKVLPGRRLRGRRPPLQPQVTVNSLRLTGPSFEGLFLCAEITPLQLQCGQCNNRRCFCTQNAWPELYCRKSSFGAECFFCFAYAAFRAN